MVFRFYRVGGKNRKKVFRFNVLVVCHWLIVIFFAALIFQALLMAVDQRSAIVLLSTMFELLSRIISK